MKITEDQIIKTYSKKRGNCNRSTLFRYEYDFTCFACG